MSQSNQPGLQNSPGRKNNSIIYWVIIVILLAGCIYLFMSKNKMAEENAATDRMQKQQYDSLSTEHTTLNAEYDAAKAKIDQLFTQNVKMDSALAGNKEEINKLKGQIASILANKKATTAELKHAREMIASLTDKTREYEARIAELEKANEVLTNKNTVLTKTVDSTSTVNANLKKIGSVLHASNIRFSPIHLGRKGKEKETKKAKKVDILRVTFDIDENRITESGNKQIYLRIMAPDGHVMASAANGSGQLTSNRGDQVPYSLVKTLAITQNQQYKNVIADWNQDGDYTSGDYTIEVYNDGYKIGAGTVHLK